MFRINQQLSYIKIILYFIISLCFGCIFDANFEKISGNFEVGYIDVKETTNIFYKDQGIFHKMEVIKYGNNETYIWVYVKDKNEFFYYIINMAQYTEHPLQLNSDGVYGPYKSYLDLYKHIDSKNIQWKQANM